VIEYVRLTNFRRHENTIIELSRNDQTVVVSGLNGSGKSTIIEAVVYALVGEGRHGRNGLERIVRRGAEIEGMEVELGFEIEGTKYRIVRRRDGKTASAVLSVNGQPMVEGTRQVTAMVEDILGMDSQGVRLAVVAQQKELDMLSKMGPANRSRAISRLLRLDAIAYAREDARAAWRTASSALDALPQTGDLVQIAGEVAKLDSELTQARNAESACRAELMMIEAELAASEGVDHSYNQAREAVAKLEGELAALVAEQNRVQAERDAVVIPDAPRAVTTTAVLERQASELEHAIANAEAQRRVGEQRRVIEQELERGVTRASELEEVLADGTAEAWLSKAAEARTQAREWRETSQKASQHREELREELGRARHEMERLRTQRDALLALEGVCETCGQEVGENHRETHAEKLLEQIATAESRAAQIIEDGKNAKAEFEDAEKAERTANTEAVEHDRRAAQAGSAEGEIQEINRRISTYRGQLERLTTSDVDVDDLYARKGALAIEVAESRHAVEIERNRTEATQRVAKLDETLTTLQKRVADVRTSRNAVQVTEELERSWRMRNELADRHRAEMVMLTALVSESARSSEQHAVLGANLRHANEIAASRRTQQQRGRDAANAQKLLADVEQTIGGAIRPQLESGISDILCQMSEGRFESVKVSAEYDVSVKDDGAYRNIADLSGGEADLVALAVRLALADIVCQRNGEIGFLILDEPFGSQDSVRRESILAALRTLRSRYGQIWCISHVGGLDEVADRVVSVEVDERGISIAV
jgi:exonuclease SbcC